MSAYILILTMAFKSGYSGMGGIESIDVSSLESCNRIGMTWVRDEKKAKSLWSDNDHEFRYLCVKR